MLRLTQVQDSFIEDMRTLEEFNLNKIAKLEAEKLIIIEKHEVVILERIDQVRAEMNIEIRRLSDLVNIYKEKLTRREQENRNLLVELKQYKKYKKLYEESEQKYNYKVNELS